MNIFLQALLLILSTLFAKILKFPQSFIQNKILLDTFGSLNTERDFTEIKIILSKRILLPAETFLLLKNLQTF